MVPADRAIGSCAPACVIAELAALTSTGPVSRGGTVRSTRIQPAGEAPSAGAPSSGAPAAGAPSAGSPATDPLSAGPPPVRAPEEMSIPKMVWKAST